MYLIPSDRYQALIKDKGTPESQLKQSKNEPDDVKLAKYNDAYVRKESKRKNARNTDLNEYIKRMKPILEGSACDLETITSSFPADQHGKVREILNILTRLPKIVVTAQQLKIDGQTLSQSPVTIFQEMIDNGVDGVDSVIARLRGTKQKREKTEVPSPIKSPKTSSSFSKFMTPFLEDQSTPQRASRSLDRSNLGMRKETSASPLPSPYNRRLRTRKKKNNVSGNQSRWENY